MPLYASRDSNSGVVPVVDRNHPSPDPGVVVEEPAFLEGLYLRLAAVRKQLSNIWAKYHGDQMCPKPYDPNTGSMIEQQVEYNRQKTKLEIEESALVAQINDFVYVASLAVNDHDVDDEPSEAHNVITPAGGDITGAPDRT